MSTRPSSRSKRIQRVSGCARALRAGTVLALCGSAFAQGLVNGGSVGGSISAPGERDSYTFDARIGDRFELRLADVGASEFEPRLELFNPVGALVATGAGTDVAVLDTRHIEFGSENRPGRWTVVASNASTAGSRTGDYELRFVLAPGANAGGELLDGVTTFGEIELGELDSFTFTTEAGRTVEGTVTALYGSTLRLRSEVFSTNGYSVGVGGTHHFTMGPTTGGTHTLVVSDGSPGGAGTGRYSILVHGLAAAPPYPPSEFLPSASVGDPLLLDNAGAAGLGPRIGNPAEPFNAVLECTLADTPSTYVLMLSLHRHAAVSTPWGLGYLEAPALMSRVGNHNRSVESWFPAPAGLPLPNDPALIGVSYTVQGLCGGFAGSMRLSNAITQTIGG